MTALLDMAAARPPGIADARVPCPLCGGLIHPVAGRCKHCKEDLTTLRAARPQAAVALPSLVAMRTANTNGVTGTNGHAATTAAAVSTATAVPVIPVATQEASQPILPPRTTARSLPAQRPSSAWRSWPMLVIVVAVIAIVAAIVIMVMPPEHAKQGGKMSAPPAPERMETNPLPEKQSQLDPWGQPGTVPQQPPAGQPGQPQVVPPKAAVPAPAIPTPLDPDDAWGDTDPDDLGLGGITGGGAGGIGTLGGGTADASFMITALDHACSKLKSCPDVDQSMLTSVCDAVAMMPKPRTQPSCAAAAKCIEAIDQLRCSDVQMASPHSVFTMFNTCTVAATRC